MFETDHKFDKDKIINFINSQREQMMEMIKKAELLANQHMQKLISQSTEQMHSNLNAEIKRLLRLQKINPGIKDLEIEQLKEIIKLSQKNLQQTQLRLDAIRFVISN
jgi:ATP-dependent helicase HepA